jgi:Cd2+/Zn2+-exporting ATPase
MNLVEEAAGSKARTEKTITSFSRYYTPAVVALAAGIAIIPPLATGAAFATWLYRALVLLVISCPCALVISVPMSFFGGIGAASQKGILVKGSNYLEALNRVNTAVFDKTGTLTRGTFRVTKEAPAEGVSNDSLLDLAAHAELYSSHPIALSIREAYGKEPDASRISDYEEITGKGVRAKIDGRPVLAGKATLLDGEQIPHPEPEKEGTIVFLAADGRFFGYLIISDELKPDSAGTISGLESSNIHTVMLTGDSRAAGERTADRLGIKVFYTDLLPQQKVEITQELKQELPAGGKLLFVGDGINDAPVLTSADIGVAMGGLGSDAAIEAADVVLMTDEPSKLITAIQIARKTHAIVQQNIIFALFVKLLILVLAAFGIATMWAAVFGDVGVTVIAVLNSIRTTSIGRYGNGRKA